MLPTKKITIAFLLFIGFAVSAFRSDNAVTVPTDDFATVIIYRGGQLFGATKNYVIFANGERICELSNNKYIEHRVKPGHISYMANETGINLFKKETGFALDTEAGKKYYIQCTVKTSFTRSRMELSEVTENTAKRDMEKLTVDNCQERMNKN